MQDRHAPEPVVNFLPVRERSRLILANLEDRLRMVMPRAMRAAGLEMWIILCQEDDLDPVYTTLIPMDTWCPILQMLVFHDRGDEGTEGINISGTDTRDLYTHPYRGQKPEEQWPILRRLVSERAPRRIGINTGSVQWAAGGLTQNLYSQLVAELPEGYAERLVSAEHAATVWLANLTEADIAAFGHVVAAAKAVIARCYSRSAIEPGVTTTEDLEWRYWQTCADNGLDVSFRPYFTIRRPPALAREHDPADRVIRTGDFLHCDVGVKYLRLNSDHQQWAYIARPGESNAPEGARRVFAEANRLQDVFMSEFKQGLTGNELLANILGRARAEGIPNPRVYSHSLGYMLHEPGPLIGLPWEQERCPGRGDVPLDYGNAFTMELSVAAPVPEWDGADLRLSVEEDVVFTRSGCAVVGPRQTDFAVL
jgi:Xaa-Pro aminopeptidase